MTRPRLDCPDVSFGGFRIGLFFLLTVVWVGSSPAPDEKGGRVRKCIDSGLGQVHLRHRLHWTLRWTTTPRPRTTCSYRDKIQRYMLTNPCAQVLKGSTYVPIFKKNQRSRTHLNTFDFIRFSWLLSGCDCRRRSRLEKKHTVLRTNRFGTCSDNYETIINLSDITLIQLQKDVLCGGMDFGIPLRFRKTDILAEFELLHQQLSSIPAKSDIAAGSCRALLAAEAFRFAQLPPDTRSFTLSREHMKVINELRKNPVNRYLSTGQRPCNSHLVCG